MAHWPLLIAAFLLGRLCGPGREKRKSKCKPKCKYIKE